MTSKKIFAEFYATFIYIFGYFGTLVLFNNQLTSIQVNILAAIVVSGIVLINTYLFSNLVNAFANPIILFGQFICNKLPLKIFLSYLLTQIIGATVAFFIIIQLYNQTNHYDAVVNLGINGYGIHSPGGYSLLIIMILLIILNAFLIFIYLNIESNIASFSMNGVIMAFGYLIINLLLIPLTGGNINPITAILSTILAPTWGIEKLWLFIISPIIGCLVGVATFKFIK